MNDVRLMVVKALIDLKKRDSYSNIAVDNLIKSLDLDRKDSGFATALFYGVIERMLTLDHVISQYSKLHLRKLSPMVLYSLRIAVYQLLYMDKVPESAAVNESVNIVKKLGGARSSGFVNAVLRNFLREGKKYTLPEDLVHRLSVEFSCSRWIIESFINDYGLENCKGILSQINSHQGVTIRVNTTKISSSELKNELVSNGITVTESELSPHCLILKDAGNIEKVAGFQQGYFHVQDTSSQLCATFLQAEPNQKILDVCAAPGGKSFTIAQTMNDIGEIHSLDLYQHKINLIKYGAARLGLNSIKCYINDASKFNARLGLFDRVLCDLPCSGLGILSKKPEIRYKNVAFLDNIEALQYDLLNKSSNYVKDGGLLLYSTCTLRNVENKNVAERFLEQNKNFSPVDVFGDLNRAIDEPNNMFTFMPHIHKTDGFFVAAFKKRGE